MSVLLAHLIEYCCSVIIMLKCKGLALSCHLLSCSGGLSVIQTLLGSSEWDSRVEISGMVQQQLAKSLTFWGWCEMNEKATEISELGLGINEHL